MGSINPLPPTTAREKESREQFLFHFLWTIFGVVGQACFIRSRSLIYGIIIKVFCSLMLKSFLSHDAHLNQLSVSHDPALRGFLIETILSRLVYLKMRSPSFLPPPSHSFYYAIFPQSLFSYEKIMHKRGGTAGKKWKPFFSLIELSPFFPAEI